MKFSAFHVSCGAFFSLGVDAAPENDLVLHLPGWIEPLFSKVYASYTDAGEEDGYTMHEHYTFFESEGDPTSDPVIMWTNGGPGASSLFGSFSELGPYYFSKMSLQTESYKESGIPTIIENEYRWTKLGSLLIRNLPPPTGYSYCDPIGPSGDGHSCGSWNDTKTAAHSLTFMENWFKAFPEYAERDLYLIGESYAGIYIPTLTRNILGSSLAPQLKGIAVGDGCLGKDGGGCLPAQYEGPFFQAEFLHGHHQISTKTYYEILADCTHEELFGRVQSAECSAAVARMEEEFGSSFAYNLYDECYDNLATNSRLEQSMRNRLNGVTYEPHHMDGFPCGPTEVLPIWTNLSSVKEALHVADDAFFFNADNVDGFTYNDTEPSLMPFYKALAELTDVRVLIYNGDTDPGLNSFIGENWTGSSGLSLEESWRPWTLDGGVHIGGYVTRYAHDFQYLTIRGSGHMVPEYKPAAAFAFLQKWLANEDMPRYSQLADFAPVLGVRERVRGQQQEAPITMV